MTDGSEFQVKAQGMSAQKNREAGCGDGSVKMLATLAEDLSLVPISPIGQLPSSENPMPSSWPFLEPALNRIYPHRDIPYVNRFKIK